MKGLCVEKKSIFISVASTPQHSFRKFIKRLWNNISNNYPTKQQSLGLVHLIRFAKADRAREHLNFSNELTNLESY